MAYGMELDGANLSDYAYMVLLQRGTRTIPYNHIGGGYYWHVDYFEFPIPRPDAAAPANQAYMFIGNTSGGCVLTHVYPVAGFSPPKAIGVRVWSDNNTPVTYDYQLMVHPRLAPDPVGYGAASYDDYGYVNGRLDLPFMNIMTQPLVDTPTYNNYYSYGYGGVMSNAPNGGLKVYYSGTGGAYYLEGVSLRNSGGVTTYRFNRTYMAGSTIPNINTRPPLFLSMITN